MCPSLRPSACLACAPHPSEPQCDPTWVSDAYGGKFDRTGVCNNPDESVVVQVTDSCPCYYPTNAYSNKR